MEKIINLFRLKNYSFTTKVIFAFFIIIVMFSIIRAILTLPKIQAKNEKEVVDYVSRTLGIITNQFAMTGKSIKMQAQLEMDLNRQKIALELLTLKSKSQNKSLEEVLERFSQNKVLSLCNQTTSLESQTQRFHYNQKDVLNQWLEVESSQLNKTYKNKKYYFYNTFFPAQNITLSMACTRQELNKGHGPFEKSLKAHIHTKLLEDSTLPSTQTALFWVNNRMKSQMDEPLYMQNEQRRKERYTVSLLSNVRNIPTGNLSLQNILNAKQNEPIEHEIEGRRVLTWIINLSNNAKGQYFFLAHTIDKKEIQQRNNAGLSFLLTETLIAIGLSFLIILFLFKKAFTKVDTITKTALLVNQGSKNIRSHVKGEDDIGILGQAFDSMLDRFENSIQTLDKKVEEKTKEISKSLKEKEILLKEIHHRVKNNLALTIGLLELQEEEVQDSKTKKVLIEIQERIFTMELLHRKLYESSNINDIPFKEYVIDLVQAIARTYDMNKEVKVDIVMNALQMNIEKAMPFGLVLNELVTNAFKYAFKENPSPTLLISICEENEQLIMTIHDNGKGLQKSFEEIQNNTLGLKLMSTIVRHQLFGKIVYEYDKGAKFTITGEFQNA
ncbi:histidine kinase dimerization/phosphoacceptor domain -containing protein [Candidatus Marinarcus aquaticus]|uniref:histidine kinase dimerization/phosphoacceptor domain -containing protein n=1 Tax=Candidatus Marinarcus aquaticus TaxID=2044504 RepID=UPI001D1793EA|nr:histidine kinase dimerization/phosphoacceptor domain -containing protein [Candidatus Marinarcus aquaticus]